MCIKDYMKSKWIILITDWNWLMDSDYQKPVEKIVVWVKITMKHISFHFSISYVT